MAAFTGKVKWFNASKGFGFILPDDGGPDIFVHSSDLAKSGLTKGISEDDKLTFDTEAGRNGKGPKAVNIARA
jgi:CspA family cold shock protein